MSGAQQPDKNGSSERWEYRLLRPVIAHSRWVLIAVAVLTVVAMLLASTLEFESSIEVWFVEDDPDLLAYHEFLERFEADEVVLLAVFADDVFTPERLEQVRRITRRLEAEAPFVHRVRSMSNVDVFELDTTSEDKTITIGPVIPESGALTQANTADVRQRALSNPLIVGSFVGVKGDAAAFLVEIDRSATDIDKKIQLLDAIERIVDEEGGGQLDSVIAGGAVLDRAFFLYSERDFLILGPLAILLILIATFFVFRRVSATMVPLCVVVVASIWTFGLMGLLGRRIDVLSSGLVALVMAVGVADTLHVLAEYDQMLRAGKTREEAVHASVSELLIPCMFTSLTTAAGLLSLMVSGLDPVAAFGAYAALGVTFAFLLSITLVPALLVGVREPSPKYIEAQTKGRMHGLLIFLGRPTRTRIWATLAVTLIITVLSAVAIAGLDIGSNPMNYFKPSDPIRSDTMRVDEALGGTTTVEFLVEAPNRGMKNLEVLGRVEALQNTLAAMPAVVRVDSPLTSLYELNRLWTDGRPESAVLPDSEAKVGALFRMIEDDEFFTSMMQDDYSVARMTARVEMSKAGKLAAEFDRIERTLEEDYQSDDLKISATGFVKLMGNMEYYLLNSQIRSLLLAAVVVTFMIMLLLRSVRLALLSMIPNIVPILIGLGFMAAAGIALDPGTVMIGSIALGLVVDDTVHFMVRLRRNLLGGDELDVSIRRTMLQTGRPIIVTSVVLAFSFLSLTFGSSFAPNAYFGLVSALVISVALLADLLVLPASLLALRPKLLQSSRVEDDPDRSPNQAVKKIRMNGFDGSKDAE
ncbi:MAG: hypothetical protein AUK47_16295 [Deltaproteobacteria bacterium CG2_30_63_29]|nr:MAG: hypothetical protein AUK47_16295 [Deltaproteobacteria bacterium CG2_30_63_29]